MWGGRCQQCVRVTATVLPLTAETVLAATLTGQSTVPEIRGEP